MEQSPAGYLPRVYYGLTRGSQTYRFAEDAAIYQTITGDVGTAFELYSTNETDNSYIPAIAVKLNETVLGIIIQGDYNYDNTVFTAVNMTTGASTTVTFDSSPLSLQDASSLSDYPAVDNKEKQITVINNLETNSKNVVFASIDINSDGVYNWIDIANFVDGKDGTSIKSVNSSTYATIVPDLKIGDSILSTAEFTTGDTTFHIGDVYSVTAISPFTISYLGNIRGDQGIQGIQGIPGQDGSDGNTPYIQDGYWYINGINTNVKAVGTDGTNGQNGQSFQMQSGLYSTPDNWGETGNVDADGNPLLQLPTLPQSNISGKGYVVYDPLTTPLSPYYDLYYANNGDVTWTIIHPFSGIAGQDGTDGQTPYISGGTWWIGSTNTGVNATGPQGPAGQDGSNGSPGANGLTPFIQNGTWWIGTTDTGVNATGPQGSPGTNGTNGNTPYISGGTWWIGTTNTGVNATGPQGNPGANGTSMRTGSGAPSSSLGINGDVYLNTSNYDLYTKSSGTWTLVGNIKGATGATGATGPAGATFTYDSSTYTLNIVTP